MIVVATPKENRPSTVILRFASVYGGPFDHRTRLIPALVHAALGNQPLVIMNEHQVQKNRLSSFSSLTLYCNL